jgi:predicted metal-dependent peptidase
MNAEEKLIRARIQIQTRNPFFARLSLYLKFIEAKKSDESLGEHSCGIDNQGNLYYNPKWIEGLTDEQCIGLILHEIMHLSFLHLLRRGTRNFEGWNVSTDIAINKLLLDNNFQLPPNGLLPEGNSIDLRDLGLPQIIHDLDEKSAELIYDELKFRKGPGKGKGKGKGGFDNHIEGKEPTPKQKRKMEEEWLNRLEDAYVGARMKGNVPAGIERLMGKIHESKINWKTIFRRYVLSYIPYDYTYARPNKKSISAGYYLPDYLKEKIKVVIAIDTSGSIRDKEFADFKSEIIGMAKAYQSRIDMRLLCHDTDIREDLMVANGNIAKIMSLKAKGGGGTSHVEVFKFIEKNIPDCRVALFFTDGCSDLGSMPFKERFAKIFLITEGGSDGWAKGKPCKVIKYRGSK